MPNKKQLKAAIDLIINARPYNAEFCNELGMPHTAFVRDLWGEHPPSMDYQRKWAGEIIYTAITEGMENE